MTQQQYDLIQQQLTRHEYGDRSRSAALLAWFLEHVWRLDPDQIEDAICDGRGDKGIDGLVVNEDAREITLFQTKHVEDPGKTQGDTKIREFRGVDSYFRNSETVDQLLASNPREELVLLLTRNQVSDRLGDGTDWSVQLVYVTDAVADDNATGYMAATAGDTPPLELWDRGRLHPIAERTALRELLDVRVVLTAQDSLRHALGDDTEMAVAIVPASDLVQLPGIDNLTVFDLNVRLSLGRTRINRELKQAVQDAADHVMFPAFHNGLTLLTRELQLDQESKELRLDGVSVVNGCQSLVSLYQNKTHLTDDLALLVKVVQLGGDPGLAEEITYRSNNQNPVNFRDQRSTDATQRDLQNQVKEHYDGRLFYSIREGEPAPAGAEVLDNRLAAQLLMAIYVGEPHRAVRKVALFDKEYHRVFSRDVDAHRLYLVHLLNTAAREHRGDLREELAAAFASVRFTLVSMVAEVIELSGLGEAFIASPGPWLLTRHDEVVGEIERFTQDVIDSINFHVEEEEGEAREADRLYDPKVVFKSADGVRRLHQRAVQDAKRATRRAERDAEVYEFSVEPDS